MSYAQPVRNCGACKWWKGPMYQAIDDDSFRVPFQVGMCVWPRPFWMMRQEVGVSTHASSGQDCPTWEAK